MSEQPPPFKNAGHQNDFFVEKIQELGALTGSLAESSELRAQAEALTIRAAAVRLEGEEADQLARDITGFLEAHAAPHAHQMNSEGGPGNSESSIEAIRTQLQYWRGRISDIEGPPTDEAALDEDKKDEDIKRSRASSGPEFTPLKEAFSEYEQQAEALLANPSVFDESKISQLEAASAQVKKTLETYTKVYAVRGEVLNKNNERRNKINASSLDEGRRTVLFKENTDLLSSQLTALHDYLEKENPGDISMLKEDFVKQNEAFLASMEAELGTVEGAAKEGVADTAETVTRAKVEESAPGADQDSPPAGEKVNPENPVASDVLSRASLELAKNADRPEKVAGIAGLVAELQMLEQQRPKDGRSTPELLGAIATEEDMLEQELQKLAGSAPEGGEHWAEMVGSGVNDEEASKVPKAKVTVSDSGVRESGSGALEPGTEHAADAVPNSGDGKAPADPAVPAVEGAGEPKAPPAPEDESVSERQAAKEQYTMYRNELRAVEKEYLEALSEQTKAKRAVSALRGHLVPSAEKLQKERAADEKVKEVRARYEATLNEVEEKRKERMGQAVERLVARRKKSPNEDPAQAEQEARDSKSRRFMALHEALLMRQTATMIELAKGIGGKADMSAAIAKRVGLMDMNGKIRAFDYDKDAKKEDGKTPLRTEEEMAAVVEKRKKEWQAYEQAVGGRKDPNILINAYKNAMGYYNRLSFKQKLAIRTTIGGVIGVATGGIGSVAAGAARAAGGFLGGAAWMFGVTKYGHAGAEKFTKKRTKNLIDERQGTLAERQAKYLGYRKTERNLKRGTTALGAAGAFVIGAEAGAAAQDAFGGPDYDVGVGVTRAVEGYQHTAENIARAAREGSAVVANAAADTLDNLADSIEQSRGNIIETPEWDKAAAGFVREAGGYMRGLTEEQGGTSGGGTGGPSDTTIEGAGGAGADKLGAPSAHAGTGLGATTESKYAAYDAELTASTMRNIRAVTPPEVAHGAEYEARRHFPGSADAPIQAPESPKVLKVEGVYEHGSSVTREIEQYLAKNRPDLTPAQRVSVAYRLALDEIAQSKVNPSVKSGLNYVGDNPSLVREGTSYSIELNDDQINKHVARVRGDVVRPSDAAEKHSLPRPEPRPTGAFEERYGGRAADHPYVEQGGLRGAVSEMKNVPFRTDAVFREKIAWLWDENRVSKAVPPAARLELRSLLSQPEVLKSIKVSELADRTLGNAHYTVGGNRVPLSPSVESALRSAYQGMIKGFPADHPLFKNPSATFEDVVHASYEVNKGYGDPLSGARVPKGASELTPNEAAAVRAAREHFSEYQGSDGAWRDVPDATRRAVAIQEGMKYYQRADGTLGDVTETEPVQAPHQESKSVRAPTRPAASAEEAASTRQLVEPSSTQRGPANPVHAMLETLREPGNTQEVISQLPTAEQTRLTGLLAEAQQKNPSGKNFLWRDGNGNIYLIEDRGTGTSVQMSRKLVYSGGKVTAEGVSPAAAPEAVRTASEPTAEAVAELRRAYPNATIAVEEAPGGRRVVVVRDPRFGNGQVRHYVNNNQAAYHEAARAAAIRDSEVRYAERVAGRGGTRYGGRISGYHGPRAPTVRMEAGVGGQTVVELPGTSDGRRWGVPLGAKASVTVDTGAFKNPRVPVITTEYVPKSIRASHDFRTGRSDVQVRGGYHRVRYHRAG